MWVVFLVIDLFERYYIDEIRNKIKRKYIFIHGSSWHNKKKIQFAQFNASLN
jgi:hypothetical protein